MNEYSVCVRDGIIIGDSTFYVLAHDMLANECKRLCDFTDALDKDQTRKKGSIVEYKCAKYRYASVSLIHSIFYNNNYYRKLHNLEFSHYLLLPFDEIFKEQTEYLTIYESAPTNEKPDYSLYYGILAFAAKEVAELVSKLKNASDFEKIELEERIGGLKFAVECLNEAWQKRKEVAK